MRLPLANEQQLRLPAMLSIFINLKANLKSFHCMIWQIREGADLQGWLSKGLHAHKPLLPHQRLHHFAAPLRAGNPHYVGFLTDHQPSLLQDTAPQLIIQALRCWTCLS